MLSFRVVNLLPPSNSEKLFLSLVSGTWTLERVSDFDRAKEEMGQGKCAETYFLENPVGMSDGAAVLDAALDEITPVLLAASYATGQSVTIKRSTPMSDVSFLQPTDHWPRERAMRQQSLIVTSGAEFIALVESFVRSWPLAGQTEKSRLLIHHWLDSLSCWSMEDLYLSATTLLQVIVATEAARQGKQELPYYDGVKDAAAIMGIRVLGSDFKNMRNELIHDGQLVGRRFSGPDKLACAAVIADVLNWFDEYVHAALGLGTPRKTRFDSRDFTGLNAYSLN